VAHVPHSLAIAFASHVPETARQRDQATLERIGVRPVVIADSPGLAVTRTVSMLINGARDAARDRERGRNEAPPPAARKLNGLRHQPPARHRDANLQSAA